MSSVLRSLAVLMALAFVLVPVASGQAPIPPPAIDLHYDGSQLIVSSTYNPGTTMSIQWVLDGSTDQTEDFTLNDQSQAILTPPEKAIAIVFGKGANGVIIQSNLIKLGDAIYSLPRHILTVNQEASEVVFRSQQANNFWVIWETETAYIGQNIFISNGEARISIPAGANSLFIRHQEISVSSNMTESGGWYLINKAATLPFHLCLPCLFGK